MNIARVGYQPSNIGNNTSKYYQQMSSGKKINKAADDAAGLAIAQKLKNQRTGLDVGTENAGAAYSMTRIADGAMSSATDSLQRMRELSIKASNPFYGDEERSYIQNEIDGLKDSISGIAGNTNFNEINLLDGSSDSIHVASNPDGTGSNVKMADLSLQSLGIENYDVTGKFDISQIDSALEKLTGSRSQMGAQSNGLEHTMSYNQSASYNMSASKSRIEDLDYGKAVSESKKEELLDQYRLFSMRKQSEEDGKVTRLLQFS